MQKQGPLCKSCCWCQWTKECSEYKNSHQ